MVLRINAHGAVWLLISIAVCFMFFACERVGSLESRNDSAEQSEGEKLTVDSTSFTIRRYELDAGTENMAFYFEIPVWEADSPAAEKFNSFFTALYDDFVESEPERVCEIVSSAVPGTPSVENPYRDCWIATVRACSERYISVSIAYDWYMGGVIDYGINGYTFDRLSGERVYLKDVLLESDETIKAAIIDGLREAYPGIEELSDAQGENSALVAVKAIPVRDIDFFIAEEGRVTVVFDKYEIAPGAAGMFSAELKGCRYYE